jgi:hypothetical protein
LPVTTASLPNTAHEYPPGETPTMAAQTGPFVETETTQ